jgi:thiol-disulfide isomerase/thioredoxin
MKPRFNNIPKGATLVKMFSSSGNSTNLLLLVGGVVLLIGVIYMLVQTRSSHEGFEAPLEWDHDKEVMVIFHKMKGCPHCDDFQTVWDEVYDIVPGEVRSKKNKTCKMVTVAPNHPIEKTSAPVTGFPTLRIYKTPADYVEFNGHRTKEEVVDFILKNA